LKTDFLEATVKISTADELLRSTNPAFLFKSLAADDVETSLLPFYLALDFDARRKRFCGAVSDNAIERHCRTLDFDHAIVLACSGRTGLVATIELHPLVPDWQYAELALAEPAVADRTTIVAHLLQLAAFAAGKRGCTEFVIQCCSPERDYLHLLRGIGRIRTQTDLLRVELGEYSGLGM
jgi:hypothetical protein